MPQPSQPQRRSDRSDPGVEFVDSSWFEGGAAFLDGLTAEVRDVLRREPDTGDLLLVFGSAPESLLAEVLLELGIDIDELPAVVNRLRIETADRHPEHQIEAVRQAKERAADEERADLVAELRAEEGRLTGAWRLARESSEQHTRRRLGIANSTGDGSPM
jgi:hypothetical protein